MELFPPFELRSILRLGQFYVGAIIVYKKEKDRCREQGGCDTLDPTLGQPLFPTLDLNLLTAHSNSCRKTMISLKEPLWVFCIIFIL